MLHHSVPSQTSSADNEPSEERLDAQMRRAYTIWSAKCRAESIPTTPAYDVVGLLAVMRPEKFDLCGKTTMVLQQEFRRVDGFRPEDYRVPDNSACRANNLVVVTDFGEECDDEVVTLLVPPSARLVFTDEERFEEHVAQYRSFGGTCSVHHVHELWNLLRDDPAAVILQIGPLHERVHGMLRVPADISYDWYLVGALGNTLNSKGDALENAKALRDGAATAWIVDTDRGRGAFPFSYGQLQAVLKHRLLPTQFHRIAEHVLSVGWRNTVGRANPLAGKFVAHLVVPGVGANYQTVDTVARACLTELHPPIDIDAIQKLQATHDGTRTVAAAMRLAKTYLDRLQFAAPDTLDPDYEALSDGTFRRKDASHDAILEDGAVRFGVPWTTVKPQQFRLMVDAEGNTNSVAASVTAGQIVEGYAVMLVLLHHLFEVPVEFLESGRPGQWNPQWDHPGPLADEQVAKHPFVKTL